MNLKLYQARNGAIYLANGSQATRLTHDQLMELALAIPDLHELNDFDYDLYQKAYETPPAPPLPTEGTFSPPITLSQAAQEVVSWYEENLSDTIERGYVIKNLRAILQGSIPFAGV